MANAVDSQGADSGAFIGSREKAKNGYGQNGYQGPSSDLPGQATRMNRDFGLPADPTVGTDDWQTRKVSADAYAPAHGMKTPAEPAKVPSANVRKSSVQKAAGSFQR